MEVLVLDGRKYIKASKAANELGYTADYVGQLCRRGKVSAHLIGRSWYVDQDELSMHRREKKRMSRIKAREQAKRSIEAHRKKINSPKETYKNITILYEEDHSDLIPETRRIEVESELGETVKKRKATTKKKLKVIEDTPHNDIGVEHTKNSFMVKLEDASVISSDLEQDTVTEQSHVVQETLTDEAGNQISTEVPRSTFLHVFVTALLIIGVVLTVFVSQTIIYTSDSVIPISRSFSYDILDTISLLMELF